MKPRAESRRQPPSSEPITTGEEEKAIRRLDFGKLVRGLPTDDKVLVMMFLRAAMEDRKIEEIIGQLPITPIELKKLFLEIFTKYESLRTLPPDYDELRDYLHRDKMFHSTKELGIDRPLGSGATS